MFLALTVPPKKAIVAIAAAASFTLLAGCGSDDVSNAPTPPAPESSAPASAASEPASSTAAESSSSPEPSTSADANQALRDAGGLALKQVSDSTLISIETTNNESQWEVQVVTSDGVEHEMNISADGTEVVDKPRTEDEDAEDKRKHQDRVKAAKLDFKQAAEKIVDEVPGGRITELNLDGENNATVWEADVMANSAKRSIQIDAVSGDVLKNEADS